MHKEELSALLPADFSNTSRIWIFQGSRPFIEKEQLQIDEQLYQFYTQWTAHGAPVKGWAKLLFNQFVIVMADESGTHVSGCSTDGMIRVIKSLERQYDISFFDRMTLTFLKEGKAQMLPFEQVQYAIDRGYITEDTLMFNNTAATRKELLEHWLIPVKNSWLQGRIRFSMV